MRLLLVWLLLTGVAWAKEKRPLPEQLPEDLTMLTQDERNDVMKEAIQLQVYDRLIKRGLMTENDPQVQKIPRKRRAKLREKETMGVLRQSMRKANAPVPAP